MADPLDILSLAEGRQAVGLTVGDTTQDAQLPTYITAVSRRLDKICGPVVQRTVTAELCDGGSWTIDLAMSPIVSVTTVTEYSGTASTVLTRETVGTTPSNAFLLKPWRDGLFKGRLYRRSGGTFARFPIGDQNVSVTYVAGRYADTPSVDAKFKQAAAIVLANLFRKQLLPVNPQFRGPDALGDVQMPGLPTYFLPYVAEELLIDEIIPGSA